MIPNRSRPRIVDAEQIAIDMRRTFADRDVERVTEMPFTWPTELQHVGEGLAVAYASDKWKRSGDYELYKHIHDGRSPNKALCVPGFLADYDTPSRRRDVIGPTVSFAGVPMPKQFAVIGFFEECNLRLHMAGTDDGPRFGRGDAGIVKVIVPKAMLGAGVIQWEHGDEPFIFAYTEPSGKSRGGVHMLIVGAELDIEKDGIVG